MNATFFSIEQHRLATDARQFGLWCFVTDRSGQRYAIAHAVPTTWKESRRWSVFHRRDEVAKQLTRRRAEAQLRAIGEKEAVTAAASSGGAR